MAAAIAALLCCGAAPALAQVPTDPGQGADTQESSVDEAPTVEGLLGDWGGLRSDLAERGVRMTARYASETAWNVSGGDRERVAEAGQFDIGAKVDAEQLLGLEGGTFQATVTWRRGNELGRVAGLNTLQQVQEVFGRGQTWRLTQFWYEQALAGGKVSLKLGRIPESDDFAGFSCYFQNLNFCGSSPSKVASAYWHNWPISQWAARLKVSGREGYAQIGVYEVNPKNLQKDFTIGYFSGATGIVVPGEIGWTPKLGRSRLPGTYKIGAWYSTADGDDVLLDINRQPKVQSSLPALRRSDRYGAFFHAVQQVTGTSEGDTTVRGLILFTTVTLGDRNTSTVDNHVAAGFFYKGPFRSRIQDAVGVGFGRTHINGRVAAGQRLDPTAPAVQHSEYAAEIYYGLHATPWLVVRPNIQYIINPGGVSSRDDITVLGLKIGLTL